MMSYVDLLNHPDVWLDKLIALEEWLVDSARLEPLTSTTTREEWTEYWQSVAEAYVRRYGDPRENEVAIDPS